MVPSSCLTIESGGTVTNHSGESGFLAVANPGEQMERIYTYDNNRNLIDIHAPNVPWYNQSFTYDDLNRLTTAEGRYGSISYAYDDVGNRLTRTINGETENYTYIAGTNKLDSITGTNPISFTSDANGNITAIGDKTLIYNQNNRLIKVEENSLVLGEYTYNGLGQRVTKTVDGTTKVFHYDLNGKLIAESLPDGTITAEYLYMGKIRMAKVDVSTGNIYYYLNDRLGTPQIMTDDTGTIVWEASHKPFGEASVNPKSTMENNFRFPGQYYDEETGLHYNYHRFYDPRTGRYLRPDPIGLLGGINLFLYASNNPVNVIDPLGLIKYETLKRIVNAISILDVLPIGMIPGVGQIVGEIIDIAAFGGTQAVLVADLAYEDINLSQFFLGTGLNLANFVIGSAGNLLTGPGNVLLSGVEGFVLYLQYRVTAPQTEVCE
jgi:RHS repeat-associated protein